ncbi:hypothetical protein [Candidatus Solirubrobacter pratensis]|uniref:hypothetical protein n=1 Tax=Candidatus Solirubrobacter pratensis TaxID=1298857 RepID=UPI0004149301|nr:hypothetical protein [Candidatus Solirubrobacter pratensis]
MATSHVAAAPVQVPPSKPGNTIGRLTGLTLFTPVRRRWLPVAKSAFWLGKWIPLAQKHILQFEFIHFVRWTHVDKLPDGQKLNYTHLFFESNFDGPWQHYIDAFAYCIPKDIRLVWGRGINFPAPPPAEPLKAWIAHNSMEGGTYYCAYPEASTRMVKGALEVSERFEALRAGAASMTPEQFEAAYRRFLGDVQAHI